jgi:hypothetical protein
MVFEIVAFSLFGLVEAQRQHAYGFWRERGIQSIHSISMFAKVASHWLPKTRVANLEPYHPDVIS